MHRAMDFLTFGTINKHLKSKTTFISNSKELCDFLKLNPHHFVNFMPERLYVDEKVNFPRISKEDMKLEYQRENILGHNMNKEEK